MHRAGGIAETDILDNIMFHLAAAGLWHIAELHTLARDTCMANLLTDKKFPPKNGVTPKLPSEVAQCL